MQKTFYRPFCCFCILLVLALAGLDQPAANAAADPNAQRYANLKKQFDSLKGDKKRAALRENWLSLEKGFTALSQKTKGNIRAQSLFMKARTREELSINSFNHNDMQEAANYFGAMAKSFPKHTLADDALYQQAWLLGVRLGKTAEAQTVLTDILKRYPKGDQADKAKSLQQKLKTQSSSGKSASTTATPDKPQQQKITSQLSKVTWRGNHSKATVILQLSSAANYQYAYYPPDTARKLPHRVVIELQGTAKGPQVKDTHYPQNIMAGSIRSMKDGSGLEVTINCDRLAAYKVTSPQAGLIHIDISHQDNIPKGIKVLGNASSGSPTRGSGSSSPATVLEQLGLTVKTIMLDAGHGGKDPGAQGNGIVEKHLALKMVKLLGAELQKRGYTVLYTRQRDVFIPLEKRATLANEKKVDLFISVHCNANTKSSVKGLETYYLDEAKSSSAATVAARENAVSVKKVSDLQVILADLTLNSKLEESRQLASKIHRGMTGRLKTARLGYNDNGSRSAPFYVLMGARMPAILVEIGYVTNATEAGRLKSDLYLQRLADGIANGVTNYKNALSPKTPGRKR